MDRRTTVQFFRAPEDRSGPKDTRQMAFSSHWARAEGEQECTRTEKSLSYSFTHLFPCLRFSYPPNTPPHHHHHHCFSLFLVSLSLHAQFISAFYVKPISRVVNRVNTLSETGNHTVQQVCIIKVGAAHYEGTVITCRTPVMKVNLSLLIASQGYFKLYIYNIGLFRLIST